MKKDSKSAVTKGKILIVDDTVANLRLLSIMLKEQGYDVRQAINGKTALMVLQATLPDLILLDIMMPEMNGYQVCQSLKASEKTAQIPVIFLSALDDLNDKIKGFQVGGVDYITKPFQAQEVLARIENHLTLRRLQLQLMDQNSRLQQEVEERKYTEEALRQSEAKNYALINAIPDLMFRVNANGVFLDYRTAKSHPVAALTSTHAMPNLMNSDPIENAAEPNPDFSMNEKEVTGKTVAQMFSEDLAAWTMYYVEQTLTTQQTQVGEYVQQANQRWYHYEARYVISGPDEVLAIVRDISDRKQVEAALRQSEAQLRMQQKQLTQTLDELKQTQTQLVQNAKMVSLGQLVAGVAHEINNPVNFIYGNLCHITAYTKDLLHLLQLYQQALPEPPQALKSATEDCDLDFIYDDLPKLIESMQQGSERIRDIVEALRNFSRLGEAELKAVDIHEGIESTLMMLQHRLKGELWLDAEKWPRHPRPIKLIKEYSILPLVECYPREINQVFMNILSNAIDALEMKTQKQEKPEEFSEIPTLTIRTAFLDNQWVTITIIDNGLGMTEAVKERVFDPFFTTKNVGAGVGLGMSISYQIVVDRHGGNLYCDSTPESGTQFIIEIPVRYTK